MNDWAVVTGAGSGIGRYLAFELARSAVQILGVGRRSAALEETSGIIAAAGLEGFHAVSADVATEEGRRRVIEAIGPDARIRYLAHLAGIYTVASLEDVTVEEWRQSFGIHVEARFFLTRDLLPQYVPGARVAFMNSGTAEAPKLGAVAACGSMAAAKMVRQCLAKELGGRAVLVSASRPGPVDSETMRRIEMADPEVFPYVAELVRQRRVAPETCGQYLAWWLTQTEDDDFIKDGWDIEDESHHRHWMTGDSLYI